MPDEKKLSERITVEVNGVPVKIFRGMKVRHALIAFDYEVFRRAEQGIVRVVDGHGFAVDLDGALQDGSALFLKEN